MIDGRQQIVGICNPDATRSPSIAYQNENIRQLNKHITLVNYKPTDHIAIAIVANEIDLA